MGEGKNEEMFGRKRTVCSKWLKSVLVIVLTLPSKESNYFMSLPYTLMTPRASLTSFSLLLLFLTSSFVVVFVNDQSGGV